MKKEVIGDTKKRVKRSGIYYLTDGVDVIYVGASRDVEQRVKQHAAVIDFSQVFVDDCEEREFYIREVAAIREFNPILNVQNAGWNGYWRRRRLLIERADGKLEW